MTHVIDSPVLCELAEPDAATELVNKIATSPAGRSKRREKAARRKLKTVAQEQAVHAHRHGLRAVALTLTYAKQGEFSSKHISAFIDNLRRFAKTTGHRLPYLWVLEQASHLHYHLLVWLPKGVRLPKDRLSRWWRWGSTWVEACRSAGDWAHYLRKFDGASRLPAGARLYGYGGVAADSRVAIHRSGLPQWLKAKTVNCCRRTRGGWVDTATGELFQSPYVWGPCGPRLRSECTSGTSQSRLRVHSRC